MLSHRSPIVVCALALSLAATYPHAVAAGEITLSENVAYYYYQPNRGANFVDLLKPDTYFIHDGLRYDSFTFSNPVGPASPAPSDLWLLFSQATHTRAPILVADPQVITTGFASFEVSWRVTALPESKPFTSAYLAVSDVASGVGPNGGETRVTETLVGVGGVSLGTQSAFLSSLPPFPFSSQVESSLRFTSPQSSVVIGIKVDVSNGAYRGATVGLDTGASITVPEPTTAFLYCIGLGLILGTRYLLGAVPGR